MSFNENRPSDQTSDRASDQDSAGSRDTQYFDTLPNSEAPNPNPNPNEDPQPFPSDSQPQDEQQDPQRPSLSTTPLSESVNMLAYGFFDYLLDAALGRTTEPPNVAGSPNAGEAGAPANPGSDTETSDASRRLFSTFLEPSDAFRPLGTIGTDPSGSIIITVNYMFLDGSDVDGPGRTGQLVVTLPNNPANREPRALQLFISLATRMAYSVLVSNAAKNQGISPEKFRTYPVKPTLSLEDLTCSICFEQLEDREVVLDYIDGDCITKKRRMNLKESTPTASSSSDRPQETPTLDSCSSEWDHVPIELPCGHIFGQSCLAHWLNANHSCPLCRVSLADENSQSRSSIPPVTVLRFGSTGEGTMFDGDTTTPLPNPDMPEASATTDQETQPDSAAETQNGRSQSPPGLLRRATSVIFHPHRQHSQGNPFERQNTGSSSLSTESRRRNTPVSPMINQILNLFGRNRRRREEDRTGASSIFASGVSSRRTADGVETVTNESGHNVDDFDPELDSEQPPNDPSQ